MTDLNPHSRCDARRCASPQSEDGFTLIELLLVLVILGILAALAVPAYLGFQARAADATAQSDIRSALPAAEAFSLDNSGAKGDADNKANTSGYKGMTPALLRAKYDLGLSGALTVVSAKTTATQYCLAVTQDGRSWSLLGPGAVHFFNNAKCK